VASVRIGTDSFVKNKFSGLSGLGQTNSSTAVFYRLRVAVLRPIHARSGLSSTENARAAPGSRDAKPANTSQDHRFVET
jgi:hypothetical protein